LSGAVGQARKAKTQLKARKAQKRLGKSCALLNLRIAFILSGAGAEIKKQQTLKLIFKSHLPAIVIQRSLAKGRR